jgi:hypothetical protein
MDNNGFSELKNKLAALPVLLERMNSLRSRLHEAEENVSSLLHKYQSEALDVDDLQKDKFSNTLLKLIKIHEGKVNKETQEMVTAKLEYDKAVEEVSQLTLEKAELAKRISELTSDKKVFDAEYIKRENLIKSQISDKAFAAYTNLETQLVNLSKQLAETDEALNVARQVIAAAENAIDHLKSAEGWATYDVWSRGGILSHMAKYDHIDDAQSELNRLSFLIKNFENELRDVNMYDVCEYAGIDSTTRAVDFWFDNIFTDLNVRDKIRDDMYQVQRLISQIETISNKLLENKAQIKKMQAEAETQKSKLVMDFEANN